MQVALRKCIPSLQCSVNLLTDVVDPYLLVVREDHICGSPPDSQFQAANPSLGQNISGSFHFDLGLMGPSPGLYRLCLCSDGLCMLDSAVNPTAFDKDVGDLLVSGPVSTLAFPWFFFSAKG